MTAATLWPTIESPCISICTLGDSGHCLGCFRTAQEIGDWISYSDQQRQAIIEQLPKRAEQLFEDE